MVSFVVLCSRRGTRTLTDSCPKVFKTFLSTYSNIRPTIYFFFFFGFFSKSSWYSILTLIGPNLYLEGSYVQVAVLSSPLYTLLYSVVDCFFTGILLLLIVRHKLLSPMRLRIVQKRLLHSTAHQRVLFFVSSIMILVLCSPLIYSLM